MTTSTPTRRAPAVPDPYAWTVTVVLMSTLLYAAICAVTATVDAVGLVGDLRNDSVALTVDTALTVPPSGGRNVYAGAPWVADGTAVIADRVTTRVHDVPLLTRVTLGATPLLWDLTLLAVAACIAVTAARLRRGAPFTVRSARPLLVAGAALAIGGSLAQLVGDAGRLGFGRILWQGHGIEGIPNDTEVGFSFTPLIAAAALAAIGFVIRRAAVLQSDTEGLV